MKWLNQHHQLKKLKLFLILAMLVATISAVKVLVHWMQFEFVTLSPLLTSAIGGAIFIIGFLLSGVLSDYKESERLTGDIRVALEAIHDDATSFSKTCTDFKIGPLVQLQATVKVLEESKTQVQAMANGLVGDKQRLELEFATARATLDAQKVITDAILWRFDGGDSDQAQPNVEPQGQLPFTETKVPKSRLKT